MQSTKQYYLGINFYLYRRAGELSFTFSVLELLNCFSYLRSFVNWLEDSLQFA